MVSHCNDTCCRPDYEGDEWVVVSVTEVKARKEWTCDMCGDPIRPGSYYTREFAVGDGVAVMRRCRPYCMWDLEYQKVAAMEAFNEVFGD